MAAASVVVKELDDITECPICTEVYTDPRVLPCIHTYCLKCLETWAKDKHPGDEVACPLCRKEFTLPSNGIQDLPKNFFVGKLLQIKELSEVSSRSTPCDVCSYDADGDEATVNSATMYCPDCQEKLCEACVAHHRKQRMSRSHNLIPLGEKLKSEDVYAKLKTSFCDKHPEKKLKIYCFDCKLVVCMMCCVTGHNSHKCSDVNEVAEEFRGQMTRNIDRMATGVEKCREILQSLRKDKDALIDQVTKIELEICEKAEQLKEMIERHKQKLLQELTTVKQSRVKEIDSLNEQMEQHLLMMENLKKYSHEIISRGTPCDVARAASDLHNRADELLKFDVIERSLVDLDRSDVTFTSSDFVTDDTSKTVGKIDVKPNTITLAHVVPKSDAVRAVTSLGDDVFVTRGGVKQVEVYNAATLTLQRHLPVPGLGEPAQSGLAACASNNCLYVSDRKSDCVYRIELAGNNTVTKLSVAKDPRGLSVNSAHNVLVTCYGAEKLQEFTTLGTLVREICLQTVVDPRHAVQLSSSQFVVSHWRPVRNVSLVGADGRVVRSYTDSQGSGIGRLNDPESLAVDKNGCVLVADFNNNRILALNPSLTSAQVLPLPVDGGLQQPQGLCLDESRRRLYVGEEKGGRVLMFDSVKLAV